MLAPFADWDSNRLPPNRVADVLQDSLRHRNRQAPARLSRHTIFRQNADRLATSAHCRSSLCQTSPPSVPAQAGTTDLAPPLGYGVVVAAQAPSTAIQRMSSSHPHCTHKSRWDALVASDLHEIPRGRSTSLNGKSPLNRAGCDIATGTWHYCMSRTLHPLRLLGPQPMNKGPLLHGKNNEQSQPAFRTSLQIRHQQLRA